MENKEKIYIVIIIILVIALGVAIGIGVSKKSSDSKEENNNNNVTETKKEITDETKKELANIVGLTEKGYERLTAESTKNYDKSIQEKAKTGNYGEVNGFSLLRELADISNNKEVVISNATNDEIKSIILKYAMANGMFEFDIKKNCNSAGSGTCNGISIDNYKKIAKKYNLSENGNKYYSSDMITDKYYVYYGLGTVGGPAKIEDSMSFESKDKDIILNYNIKIDYEGEGPENTNEKITFTFKQYDNGTYYLHSVKTVNA